MRVPKIKMNRKWKKRLLVISAALFGLFIIFWTAVFFYVRSHKQELIAKVEKNLSNKTGGKLVIGDVQPDFFRTFPNVSVRLDKVMLVDSLYEKHKRKLLSVNHAFLKLDLFSVFGQHPKISKLILEEGKFFLFVDPDGYSNNYVLKKDAQDTAQNKKNTDLDIKQIELRNMEFEIVNKILNKRFQVSLHNVIGKLNTNNEEIRLKAAVDALIGQLGFNLTKGSYLYNTAVNGDVVMTFNKKTKLLEFPARELKLNNAPMKIAAFFDLGKDTLVPFKLNISGRNLQYKPSLKWFAENIQAKLNKVNFEKPINVWGEISGDFFERGTNPNVEVSFETRHNVAFVQGSTFTDVTFRGRYNNEVFDGKGRSDTNSVIRLERLNAKYQEIPIVAKDITIMNLITPHVVGVLQATFDAKKLNPTIGQQFAFLKGECSYDLKYNGRLFSNSVIADNLQGTFSLKNIAFKYIPRNLEFTNAQALLEFQGPDLVIKSIKAQHEKSDVHITGRSTDFLRSFVEMPGKANLNVNLNSNNLNLTPFRTYFTQKRVARVRKGPSKAMQETEDRMNDFLTNSNVQLNLDLNKVTFQKMVATQLRSAMNFTQSGVAVQRLNLQHAGGTISLTGALNQQMANNPFNATFSVNSVEVDRFFQAMSNFGFSKLTDKNLKGSFTANGDLRGNIDEKGALMPRSLNGKINYTLSRAALLNFEALAKAKNWFKNRNLDNIKIDNFSGQVTVVNGLILIPNTLLETSAINLTFGGKYNMVNGYTNIDFSVPLRNPQKDKEREERGLEKRKGKGIVIKLNATTDENGKLKVGLGKSDDLKDKEAAQKEERK